MATKAKGVFRYSFLIIAIALIGGFAINWYMKYRFESRLNKKLAELVYDATDGFYDFSFDELSVGLFSGELSIRGVELIPDSITFQRLRGIDSLPNTYYKIHLGEIHFKGINLSWLRSYKNLNFTLFEIKSPDIQVINTGSSPDSTGEFAVKSKTLYQIISPYIETLSVSRINLLNANITYIAKDTNSPVIYALRDANFRALGFRLDKESDISGKLLFCDNFEFIADSPQQLLTSNQVVLNTKNIKLSTLDSIIQIEEVNLHPKDHFWEGRTSRIGDYMDGSVQAVNVKGIYFNREAGLNYLNAHSFDVSSTDIKYYSVKRDEVDSVKTIQKADSTDQSWSLYSIISPLLHRISIDKIGINRTNFNYTLTKDGKTDTYTLNQFDFHADRFNVDSLSEKQKKFWYVDNFTLSASNIKGLIVSNNSNINVGKLYLNTFDKQFSISDIKIEPLNTKTNSDYVIGNVGSIHIDGLDYNDGVSAQTLRMDTVNVEYFRLAGNKVQKEKKGDVDPQTVLDYLTPYSDFLSVKNIILSKGNIVLHDKNESKTYRLNELNFYAINFLIDNHTRYTSQYLFTCDDLGLSFKDFDNISPDNNYRIKIKEAEMSTLSGMFSFRDVSLTPREKEWDKAPDTFYSFSSPQVNIKGLDHQLFLEKKKIKVDKIQLNASSIGIFKTAKSVASTQVAKQEESSINGISIDTIDFSQSHIAYIDKVAKDSLNAAFNLFQLYSLKWDVNQSFNIGELLLESPVISYIQHSHKQEDTKDMQPSNSTIKEVGINKLSITNADIHIQQPKSDYKLNVDKVLLSGMKKTAGEHSLFNLATLHIVKPSLNIKKEYNTETKSKENTSTSSNLYTVIKPFADKVTVGEFSISDANINYSNQLEDGQRKQQKINETNFHIAGLTLDADKETFNVNDISFNTKNLQFPVMNDFYTLKIGSLQLNKKAGQLNISDIHLDAAYPKMEFAYHHPRHKDWFDVTVQEIALSGLDYDTYFSDKILKAKRLEVNDVVLQNFKNQNIKIQHNIMPLIYEGLQKMPLKIDIDSVETSNFTVIYEELGKNSKEPAEIIFEGMNGKLSGVTNIVSDPQQYIILKADGKFMGSGYFTAQWDIPVDSLNDHFRLSAHIHQLDLRELNRIMSPLAPVKVNRGTLNDLKFTTNATSKAAEIDMLFLYDSLHINVFKNKNDQIPHKYYTLLANTVIRSNNPNKRGKKPRFAKDVTLVRDPYHSTFNYFWQILQPAMVESVGVSKSEQNFLKKASGFFSKIKNIFRKKDDEHDDTKH
ncbi:MAG: hypothetical protein E6767_14060 [Dysgonomonas sp.]|nr:hypothetical protein [Dysgonomonas sp.]